MMASSARNANSSLVPSKGFKVASLHLILPSKVFLKQVNHTFVIALLHSVQHPEAGRVALDRDTNFVQRRLSRHVRSATIGGRDGS